MQWIRAKAAPVRASYVLYVCLDDIDNRWRGEAFEVASIDGRELIECPEKLDYSELKGFRDRAVCRDSISTFSHSELLYWMRKWRADETDDLTKRAMKLIEGDFDPARTDIKIDW